MVERKVSKGLALPESWWTEVDRAAERDGVTRGDWLRAVVAAALGYNVVAFRYVREDVKPQEDDYDPGF